MAKRSLSPSYFLLRLLGPPRIEGPDGVLNGPAAQRHRLALLALLARAPLHVLARDKLIGLLWPEMPTPTARQLLNVSVFEIRKAVGDRALVSEGDTLRLDPAHLRVDTIEFEAAISAGESEEAIAISTGPFVDGLALPDAIEFEEWVENERSRLERSYHRALEQLAGGNLAANEFDKAVEVLRRRLARTPTDGRIVQRLMEALVRAGDRAGALLAAQTHGALLRQEFDAEPDPDVAALSELIRRGGDHDTATSFAFFREEAGGPISP